MIVIQGSSRTKGNTRTVSDFLVAQSGAGFIDLWAHSLKEFTYEGAGNDDFEQIICELVQHEILVFVTPVYWYSMSARMKIFFDRITDLLKWNKELGRKLKGKKMFVLSSSMHDDAPVHFQYPFEMSAAYLGINFMGHWHTWIEDDKVSEESRIRVSELVKLAK